MRQASHIMLVEPDGIVGRQCRLAFESRGYRVSWVRDAQAAITLADECQPDVLILELALSAHSGVALLQELRSYDEWRSIPVVIFSRIPPLPELTGTQIQTELGIVSYLYKPKTSLHRLCETVGRVVAPVGAA